MAGTFEIGVVMSGAISAGAYTAGVIDYLFEALDAYYVARDQPGWDGPRHDVRISIFAGASAGGMTAAMAGLHAYKRLEHVRPSPAKPPAPQTNRLYSSWVTDIDIHRLLETSDLTGVNDQAPVESVLCCDVLDHIVNDAFDIVPGETPRRWIGRADDPALRLRLTLTNTRGVPYSFGLFGAASAERFGMVNHADYYEFALGPDADVKAAQAKGATPLNVADYQAPIWARLKQAALATGAFPVGLKPRRIERDTSDWYATNGRVGYDQNETRVVIPPDDGFRNAPEAPYHFVSVDGGTIDNDPLELARQYLAGDGQRNPRDGAKADKAVLMISPFPSQPSLPAKDEVTSLLHVFQTLGKALLQQARFKPEELHLAADERVFSRFMIAPTRQGNGSPEAKAYPIACGVLGGFGGFLHESFRRHDYLLGRRNAQAFLRWNFGLPEGNDLFKDAAINRDAWLVRSADRQRGSLDAKADAQLPFKQFSVGLDTAATQLGYPIIPLTMKLREPIVIAGADMPDPDALDLAALETSVKARASVVIERLVDQDLLRHMTAPKLWEQAEMFAARAGARLFGARIAADLAMAKIKEALDEVRKAFAP